MRNADGILVTDQLFVDVLQTGGDDRTIAEAAWVSSDRAANRSMEDVARLIKYLAKNGHWTPFGHATAQVRFQVPVFIARQLMRSNVGIVWNEESRRYVDTEPVFYIPGIDGWRERSPSMKQGSGGKHDKLLTVRNRVTHSTWDGTATAAVSAACRACLDTYNALLASGVAPEQARMVLPVNMMTTVVGMFSLAALARVYNLRQHAHAQAEIRDVAEKINVQMRNRFQYAWRALIDTVPHE